MQNMHWGDLQFFVALYRGGSLSAAGRELGVYPSTISRRLAALEATLGTLLFQRTADGFVPTAAAEEMLEAALVMERQSHLIRERLSGEAITLQGRVRVASTEHFFVYFLAAHLPRFRQAYPDISVELITGSGFADIGRGEAEVAIRFAPPDAGVPVLAADADAIVARAIGTVGIGAYVSRSYLERTGKTADDPLDSFDVVMPVARWLPGAEWIDEHMVGGPVAIRSNGLGPLLAAVQAGMGATVVPSFMAGAFSGLVPLSRAGRVATRIAWLLIPRDVRRVARVRAFAEFMAQLMEEEKDLMEGTSRQGDTEPDGTLRDEPSSTACSAKSR